ncbi:hypothetical protein Pcac1_g26953 [Phytophthora cactorum]|nr:hypothetical protein Pcac1_g26953 [Phytophthora cactorum]
MDRLGAISMPLGRKILSCQLGNGWPTPSIRPLLASAPRQCAGGGTHRRTNTALINSMAIIVFFSPALRQRARWISYARRTQPAGRKLDGSLHTPHRGASWGSGPQLCRRL